MRLVNNRVAKHWSKLDCAASDKNFYAFPPIAARSCRLIFDESDLSRKDWCEYWAAEKYFKGKIPFENALSICCGFGEVERRLARLGIARNITGIDIAPGAIEEAIKRAEAERLTNIQYLVSDINRDNLPENKYDLIWANGALHHIKDLNRVVPMLYRALKSGGCLIANEYVGPNYQQVGKRQQELVNAVKHLFPSLLRDHGAIVGKGSLKEIVKRLLRDLWNRSPLPMGIYGRLWRPVPKWYLLLKDPSECINSENIIPVLNRTFEVVEVKQFGGSILFYALEPEFFDNFDHDREDHLKLLDLLFRIEDYLIETGEIRPDNAHIVCRKK